MSDKSAQGPTRRDFYVAQAMAALLNIGEDRLSGREIIRRAIRMGDLTMKTVDLFPPGVPIDDIEKP